MHLQRNATQRNAYHNYILNNNFKFYIFQFFRAFSFLSVSFLSFIKESKSSYFFEWQKSKHAKGGQSSKTISFCQKEDKAKARFQRKTTPFRIRNSLVKTMSLRVKRSNLNVVKFNFYNLISLINKFYTKWIASGDAFAMTMKNKFAILNNNVALAHCVIQGVKTPCCSGYAFSCALKNQFEIISQLNYGFCYKNYFFSLNQVFRNSYDFGRDFDFGRNLNYGFGKDYNCNFKKNCDYGFEKNRNGGFGKNYFGNCNFGFDFGNEICGIGNNLAGFLFNRKTKK